jgi:hypothetical protein
MENVVFVLELCASSVVCSETSYVPKNLIFAAKHQADAPLELIEATDPHVCVNISYDRRRVSRRPGSRRASLLRLGGAAVKAND